jgi:O-antigen/teichoic acid export membrane protein
MALRWGLGTMASLVGTVVIARSIGPSQYGVFAAVLAIFMYLSNIGAFGLDVYLIRHVTAVTKEMVDTVFWVTTILALGLGAVAGLLAWLGPDVVHARHWTATALLGSAALPLSLIASIPLALLEKALDFRIVARVELTNQLLFYAIAVPGAIVFRDAWAPAVGLLVQQAASVFAFSLAASYRPSMTLSRRVAREGLRYGLAMTGAQSIYQLRQLVNPLIVGATLGAAATGYVALAIRMVETMSFVRTVTWRLAISAFSRIQTDLAATRRAIGDGTPLQVLALGPFLIGLCWVSTFAIPHVFGQRWVPTTIVLPFICVSYLVNIAFSTQSAALFVAGRNRAVAIFHTLHVAVFASAAALFVSHFGIIGYGYAEMAALVAYPALLWSANDAFEGSPNLSVAMVWLVCMCLALFVHSWSWLCAGALLPVLCWRRSWSTAGIVLVPLWARLARLRTG